eukprot:UN27363
MYHYTMGKSCLKSPANNTIFPPNGRLLFINNLNEDSILSKSFLLIIEISSSIKTSAFFNKIAPQEFPKILQGWLRSIFELNSK